MTYPQTVVVDAIEANCIPLQVNNADPAAQPLVQRYRHIWTPDLRLLEENGNELYRWNGYLPPFEFAPQLLSAIGQAWLRLKVFERAIAAYTDVLARFPTSIAAPEAQYFLACAKYRKSDESSDLLQGWHRLEKTYPTSEWTVKQNF